MAYEKYIYRIRVEEVKKSQTDDFSQINNHIMFMGALIVTEVSNIHREINKQYISICLNVSSTLHQRYINVISTLYQRCINVISSLHQR